MEYLPLLPASFVGILQNRLEIDVVVHHEKKKKELSTRLPPPPPPLSPPNFIQHKAVKVRRTLGQKKERKGILVVAFHKFHWCLAVFLFFVFVFAMHFSRQHYLRRDKWTNNVSVHRMSPDFSYFFISFSVLFSLTYQTNGCPIETRRVCCCVCVCVLIYCNRRQHNRYTTESNATDGYF